MYKSEIRKQYKEKRLHLLDQDRATSIEKMLLHFRKWIGEDKQMDTLLSYVPFARFAELDPSVFEAELALYHQKLMVAYPRIQGDAMQAILPFDKSNRSTNQYGIIEYDGSEIVPDKIDMVFVPLLAVDRHGHRVGYGKGYYDRYLSHLRPDCITMGISFFSPIEQILAIHQLDRKLTCCLTPDGVINFN